MGNLATLSLHHHIEKEIYVTRFTKRVLYHTVSGLAFYGYSTDTAIDQHFMLVPLSKLQRSAFTEASFVGLSGVH